MAKKKDHDALFKALADPSRRKLLDLLHAHDGRTLGELCELIGGLDLRSPKGLLQLAKVLRGLGKMSRGSKDVIPDTPARH